MVHWAGCWRSPSRLGLQIVRKRNRRAALRRAGVAGGLRLARLPDRRRKQVLEIARGLSGALRELVYLTLIDAWDDGKIASHYGITASAVRRRRKPAVKAIFDRLPPHSPRAPG